MSTQGQPVRRRSCGGSSHTNSNHLQMPTLETSRQGRSGRGRNSRFQIKMFSAPLVSLMSLLDDRAAVIYRVCAK